MWMRVLGYGMLPTGIVVALSGVLQGAGATGTTLRISIAAVVVQLPIAWWLGFPLGLGPFGVWLTFLVVWGGLRAALLALAYRRGAWAVVGVKAARR
jgi:Na+-driven multidrug efflux pump